MITIAVDAMGGDHAPTVPVEGAVLAAKEFDVAVTLVGRQTEIEAALAEQETTGLEVSIVHASEVVTMDDSASKALRSKPDSSIRVCARLVREGKAQGMISAGNTGALMAASKVVMGVIPGVSRPALAQVFPTLKGTWAVLIDVGANVDCDPDQLVEFAVMGQAYAKVICHLDKPRVGILSIGEEEAKGNELTRDATPLLKESPINFIGNVEGRDLYSGTADVIVCDGFIGNVALKVSEGVIHIIKTMLRDALEANLARQIGYLLAKEAFEEFRKRLDYSEYGGAPLLGVKGVSLICHGSSNANAIKNAVRVAAEFHEGGVNDKIEQSLLESLDAHRATESAV